MPITETRSGWLLPREFYAAHDLCFLMHDILVQLLISGEKSGIFSGRIEFDSESDAASFNGSSDIFDWLETSGRVNDRARILKAVIFPAVLSDMLHCIYEALKCSVKAKLNVSYILLRKPIQENLFVFESIILDEIDFAGKLANDPLMLRPKYAGGLDGHIKRIGSVLRAIGEDTHLDAAYLAQLRYAKVEDGFDGVCNKAIHLFTEHKAIRTEKLNVNFVFSDQDAKESQWSYLYTRLPYLMFYIYTVVEHLGEGIALTFPEYRQDMYRRIAASVTLWGQKLPEGYGLEQLDRFVNGMSRWVSGHCAAQHLRSPSKRDLRRMAASGALPGETTKSVAARHAAFELLAAAGAEERTF